METLVIALSGNAGHGKDAYGKFLIDSINDTNTITRAERFAFADALKEVCTEILGWDGNKDKDTFITWDKDKPVNVYDNRAAAEFNALGIGGHTSKHYGGRSILQAVGTFGRLAGGPNYWVERCFEKIKQRKQEWQRLSLDTNAPFVAVITDMRYVNEVYQVRNCFENNQCLKIVRPGGPFISAKAAAHSSETEQNTESFLAKIDTFIENDYTLESLQEKAKQNAARITRRIYEY